MESDYALKKKEELLITKSFSGELDKELSDLGSDLDVSDYGSDLNPDLGGVKVLDKYFEEKEKPEEKLESEEEREEKKALPTISSTPSAGKLQQQPIKSSFLTDLGSDLGNSDLDGSYLDIEEDINLSPIRSSSPPLSNLSSLSPIKGRPNDLDLDSDGEMSGESGKLAPIPVTPIKSSAPFGRIGSTLPSLSSKETKEKEKDIKEYKEPIINSTNLASIPTTPTSVPTTPTKLQPMSSFGLKKELNSKLDSGPSSFPPLHQPALGKSESGKYDAEIGSGRGLQRKELDVSSSGGSLQGIAKTEISTKPKPSLTPIASSSKVKNDSKLPLNNSMSYFCLLLVSFD